MQDHASPILWQRTFNMVQHLANRADAVDRQYFPALFSAGAQDALEHPLLGRETAIEAGTGIEADLADIACIREVALENRQLILAFGDKLRMEPQCNANMR